MEAVDETMRTKDGDSADKATSDEEVKQKRSAKKHKVDKEPKTKEVKEVLGCMHRG